MQRKVYSKAARELYGTRLVRESAHAYFVREPMPRASKLIFVIPPRHEILNGEIVPQPAFFTNKVVLNSLVRSFRADYCGILFGDFYTVGDKPYFQVRKPATAKHVLVKAMSTRRTSENIGSALFRDGGHACFQGTEHYIDYAVFDAKIIPAQVRTIIDTSSTDLSHDEQFQLAYSWLRSRIEALGWSFKMNAKSVRIDMQPASAQRFRFILKDLNTLHDALEKRELELQLQRQFQSASTDTSRRQHPTVGTASKPTRSKSRAFHFTGNAMEVAFRKVLS